MFEAIKEFIRYTKYYGWKYVRSRITWWCYYRWLDVMYYKKGIVAERCDYHIGPIVHVDVDNDYCQILSLFDHTIRGCSLSSCGVRRVPADEIIKLVNLYKRGGMDEIAKWHGWSEQQYDAFKKEWRPEENGEDNAQV